MADSPLRSSQNKEVLRPTRLPDGQAEKPEVSRESSIPSSVQEFSKLAEASWADNPNAEVDQEMLRHPETKESREHLKESLTRILARMARENKGLDLKLLSPANFSSIARKSLKDLDATDLIALQELERRSMNADPTVTEDWIAVTESVEHARSGAMGWYGEKFKEHPVLTTVASVAGAYGLYLGLSWLFRKGKAKVKEKLFSFQGVTGMLGVVGMAAFMGKDWFKQMAFEKFGWQLGDNEAKALMQGVESGKVTLDQLGKLKGNILTKADVTKTVGEAIPAVIAASLAKYGFVTREELAKATTDKVETAKETLKATLEHQRNFENYSKFVHETSPKLSINKELFNGLANIPYADFISSDEASFTDTMLKISKTIFGKEKDEKGDSPKKIQRILDAITQYGSADLRAFFVEMLKNPEHEDFKGLTVVEVMDKIYSDPSKPNKYLDKDSVKEAQKVPEYRKKIGAMLAELQSDIRKGDTHKLHDPEWRQELEANLVKAGLILATNEAKEVMLVAWHNFMPVAKVGGPEIQGIFDKLVKPTDNLLGGGIAGTTAEAYLRGAGLVALIGVPAGAGIGMIKGMAERPLFGVMHWIMSAAKGGVTGLKYSLKWPVYPAKSLTQWARYGWTPLDTAKGLYYEQVFHVDNLRNMESLK